jgi:hypothetical protein
MAQRAVEATFAGAAFAARRMQCSARSRSSQRRPHSSASPPVLLLAEPVAHAAAGPARGQSEEAARAVDAVVDEAGQPRVRPSPGDADE